MSLGILFPGQGSQSIGMMSDLYSDFKVVSEIFSEASDILSEDLWKVVKKGPDEKINDTRYTQPIMLCACYSIWKIWKDEGGDTPIFFAGHSFGEYTALVAADSLKFKDAIKLVRERARLMCDTQPGTMSAIIGLENRNIEDIIKKNNLLDEVSIANINAPGQTVISGSEKGVKSISSKCLKSGAKKSIELPVSVPAHSILMKDASTKYIEYVNKIKLLEPTVPVINNVDVKYEAEENKIKNALIRQISSPVRWVEIIEYMSQQGVNVLLELGPGKILTSLNKRIDSTIDSLYVSDIKSLENALEITNNI